MGRARRRLTKTQTELLYLTAALLLSAFLLNIVVTSTSSASNMNKAVASLASSCLATSGVCVGGSAMPSIGLGTYEMLSSRVPDAVRAAIVDSGYRRIDCAPVYFNEHIVGDALRDVLEDPSSGVRRSDLFVVSKLPSPFHRREHVERAVRKTLADLRLDYLDLYLVHWPVAFRPVEIPPDGTRGWPDEAIDDSDEGRNIDATVSVHETWSAMEALVKKGLVRHVGVSNFPVSLLHELLSKAETVPVVNQVELHPYLQQDKLIKYCNGRGIHVQAYSPLGTPGVKEKDEPDLLRDVLLVEIAEARGITVAQLCLAWALQRGTSVTVKSQSPEHQRENMVESENVVLTNDEMRRIATLDRRYRFFRPEEWWGEMAMAVFD